MGPVSSRYSRSVEDSANPSVRLAAAAITWMVWDTVINWDVEVSRCFSSANLGILIRWCHQLECIWQ